MEMDKIKLKRIENYNDHILKQQKNFLLSSFRADDHEIFQNVIYTQYLNSK